MARDAKRAFALLLDDQHKRESTQPPHFNVGPLTILETGDVVLIPRVPEAGFKLGRISFMTGASLAQGDGTDSWEFQLLLQRLVAGIREEFFLGSFSSQEFGLEPFDPYEHELDEVLLEGDVFVLRIEETGSAPVIHDLMIQVDERYGS